jgi:hypothetical protein
MQNIIKYSKIPTHHLCENLQHFFWKFWKIENILKYLYIGALRCFAHFFWSSLLIFFLFFTCDIVGLKRLGAGSTGIFKK